MPCRYELPPEKDAAERWSKIASKEAKYNLFLKEELDKCTALLCSFVQSYIKERKIPVKVLAWAKDHCEDDKVHSREWPIVIDGKSWPIPLEEINFEN